MGDLVFGSDNTLVFRSGDPGKGGAFVNYRIKKKKPERTLLKVEFQNGAPREAGVNGITNEDLLAIVADRLQCYQDGPFPCEENRLAL